MKIYNTKIKDILLKIIDEKTQVVLWNIDKFEEAINEYSLEYFEECYLMIEGIKNGVFDILLLNRRLDVTEYINKLKEYDISEDEALYIYSIFNKVIKEESWHIEVLNIEDVIETAIKEEYYKDLYVIALAYYDGLGVSQDFEEAYRLFELSKDYGNDDCFYYLGYMNENGLGTDEDIIKAKEYYEKGVSKHNSQCYYALGVLNNDIKLIKKSDDVNAYIYLGEYYKSLNEITLAKEYYKKGSELFNSICLFKYGQLLLDEGDSLGLKYIIYAYYLFNDEATYCLGYLFITGQFVNKDIKKAISLLKDAKDLNNKDAIKLLEDLENENI